MNLRNCVQCGKVFVYISRNICPECMDKEELMFEKVRDYLKENPGARIMEVNEKTEVPEDKIIKFLRDGRIVSESLGSGLLCESCGAPISTGRTCAKCREELRKGIQTITNSAKSINDVSEKNSIFDDSKKMFIADRRKKN